MNEFRAEEGTTEAFSIAICGAPTVGKLEILTRLSEASGCPLRVSVEGTAQERLVRLHLKKEVIAQSSHQSWLRSFGMSRRNTSILPNWESAVDLLDFRLVSGPMFDLEQMIYKVLRGVSLICYVIETAESGPKEGFQRDYLRTHQRLIKRELPSDIPWIWILNKIDLGTTNPLEDQIPDGQRSDLIRTVAYQGTGIEVLWDRIVGLLPT